MKQYHTPLLFIALLLIVMSNTAFIISPKVEVNVVTTTINTQAPPQYKTPKMTFFERIMLKKINKKINNSAEQADLDKQAKSAQKKGFFL